MLVVLSLSLTAAVLSLWIAAHGAGTRGLPGCGGSSACGAIVASRWSKVGMFPVAGVGAVVYLALTAVALTICVNGPSRALQGTVLCLSLMPVGVALWFIVVQALVVRRFCIYCNLVHIFGAVGCTLTMSAIHPSVELMFAVGSLAGTCVVLLIAAQFVLPSRNYAILRVRALRDESHVTPSQCIPTSTTPEDRPLPKATLHDVLPQRVSLLDDLIELRTDEWPMLGSPRAAKFIALIFDYTCTTCRIVHHVVNETVTSDSTVAILLLPLPQNPGCNPEVAEIYEGRGYACQYARLGIAVWQSRPDKFSEFDKFLSTGHEPPPLGLAVRRAEELCGVTFNPHRTDDLTDCLIRRSVDIYRVLPLRQVPSLLLPHAQVTGVLRSTQEFRSILDHQL